MFTNILNNLTKTNENIDINLWFTFANIMQEFQAISGHNNEPFKVPNCQTPLLNAITNLNTLNAQAFAQTMNLSGSSSDMLTDSSSLESPCHLSQSTMSSSGFSVPNLIHPEEERNRLKAEESLDRLTLPSSDSPHSLESPNEILTSKTKGKGTRQTLLQTNTSQVKKYTCHICAKEYHSMSALKMHIRTHTLPCRCDVCGKAFSRMWLLNGHIRTHTGEKPFSCNVCSRAFADRSNLRAHMQTHSDVKRYRCNKCGKTFSRMGLLTKHKNSNCHAKFNSKQASCETPGTLMNHSSGSQSSQDEVSQSSSISKQPFSIAFLTDVKL